jgi:hypothetical protein
MFNNCAAVQCLLQQQGQAYPHDYAQVWQVLDVDTTGLPTQE